jgi:hypothetical protein
MAFPTNDSTIVLSCACSDREARFEYNNKVFAGRFDGSISTTVGPPREDPQGGQVVPLNVVGYSTQSNVDGLGRVSLDFDFSRDVPLSTVRGEGKEFFPAVQTMQLQILVTTDALGGATLRSRELGTLVNSNVESFPPQPGATYTLQKPVDLVDEKGQVVMRLVTVNTSIVSTDSAPDKLIVGSGVVLYLDKGHSLVNGEIRVSLPRGGVLSVRLYDPEGKTIRDTGGEPVEAGMHSIPLDTSGLGDRFAWQLLLDGQAISGRMPVVVTNQDQTKMAASTRKRT